MRNEAGNALNVAPSISEWFLLRFEYNKDLQKEGNEIAILSWAPSNGRIELEYLGTIFQIYPKVLPYLQDCLRFEGKFSTKAKKKMVDVITDIVTDADSGTSQGSPFVSAEELLRKAKDDIKSQETKDDY